MSSESLLDPTGVSSITEDMGAKLDSMERDTVEGDTEEDTREEEYSPPFPASLVSLETVSPSLLVTCQSSNPNADISLH